MVGVERDAVIRSVVAFLDECVEQARTAGDGQAPFLRSVLQEFLGQDPRSLPVTALNVQPHQFVNLDVAMTQVVAANGGGEVIGVGGGDQRHHFSFGDLVQPNGRWGGYPVAAVEHSALASGPDRQNQAISFGIHLFRYQDVPVAVLQRQSQSRFGRDQAGIEVLAPGEVGASLLAQIRTAMVEHSVFRGQVLTLGPSDEAYRPGVGGISFHSRPQLDVDEIVLAPGALERIERHVVGVARHREQLLAAGQHLKRGLLLYGPPGTGKTHTVRYLLSQLTDVTTVLLSGASLRFIGPATELAVALQPALVVLEDVDLVAEGRDRHPDSQPLLFTVLEAMDGLAGDADVAFLLTTNRADLLEPALAQRPGRVDLAVEIPLPDRAARLALLALYGRGLPFTPDALASVADRTEGVTASFAKELIRRVALLAAEQGRPVTDPDLLTALEELQHDREALTRSLLGSPQVISPPGR
jgi:DNA polymerase III delta prime subunit